MAVAVPRWEDAWPRYRTQLGGDWYAGGANVGFAPCQLRFANGARLELLAPHDTAANPFLARFLEQHGPGPHHITFKVSNLDDALGRLDDHGYSPIGVDRSDESWQEAFVHPRQATGIVVQVAQAAASWVSPPPPELPAAAGAPAAFLRATHVVDNLDDALDLFAGVLGGQAHPAPPGHGGELDAVDLSWDTPLVLRLVGAPRAEHPLRAWLAGRPGRLHHLVFAVADPRPVGGDAQPGGEEIAALADEELLAVVPPDRNLGTRLVLVRTSP